jgi:hypothetical protein
MGIHYLWLMRWLLICCISFFTVSANGTGIDSFFHKRNHVVGIKYINGGIFWNDAVGIGAYYFSRLKEDKKLSLNPGLGLTYYHYSFGGELSARSSKYYGIEGVLNTRRRLSKHMHFDCGLYLYPAVVRNYHYEFLSETRRRWIDKRLSFSGSLGLGFNYGKFDATLEAGPFIHTSFNRRSIDIGGGNIIARVGLSYVLSRDKNALSCMERPQH